MSYAVDKYAHLAMSSSMSYCHVGCPPAVQCYQAFSSRRVILFPRLLQTSLSEGDNDNNLTRITIGGLFLRFVSFFSA